MEQELGSKLKQFKEQTKNDKVMLNELRLSQSKSSSILPQQQTRLAKIKEALVTGEDQEMRKEFGDTLKPTDESTLVRERSQLDLECEKLKQSYSQHRKGSATRSQNRSNSNIRKASRSIGRRMLNFKESRDDLEFGGETSTFNGGNKENTMSSTNLANRYKRNGQNDNSLQNYQEKYNKLEENFKKFTQGLQSKRTGSTAANTMIGAGRSTIGMTQSNAQPLVPIASEASPIRQRSKSPMQTLNASRQFNPVGLSQTQLQGFTPNIMSRQELDKSMGIETILEIQGLPPTGQQYQTILSLDPSSFEAGSSRLHMLQKLVARMNHFIEHSFSHLAGLCISKQQEKQVQDLQTEMQQLVAKTAVSVQRINSNGDGTEELESECYKVQDVFQTCLENLQTCFTEILSRIYQVESETFKQYKFKDTMATLELIMNESHRLNLYQLLPTLIDSLKYRRVQAAAGLLQAQLTKRSMLRTKRYFVCWRQKAGLTQYLTSTFRNAALSKAVHRWVSNWQQKSLVRYVHIWKQLLFNQKQRMIQNTETGSLLEGILLSNQKFSECLGKDEALATILAIRIKETMGDYCDIQFLGQEEIAQDEESVRIVETLTGYDFDQGFPRQVSLQAIEQSLTHPSLERTPRSQGQVKLTQNIFSSKLFNEQVDAPLLPRAYLQSKTFQDLNMLTVPLQDSGLQLIGLMRVFTPNQFTDEMQDLYIKVAGSIGQFCERIQSLRSQIGSMETGLQIKNDQVQMQGLELFVHNCLFDILEGIQGGTKDDFLQSVQQRSDGMLNQLLEGCKLRQIYQKVRDTKDPYVLHKIINKPLFDESEVEMGGLTFVRQRDHKEAKQQILEDFVDYHQEKIVHQISIDGDHFNLVFHRDLPKDAYAHVRETLNNNLRFAFSLFAKSLHPVLSQGLKIHEELAVQVKNQARELVRQVSINSSQEDFRKQIIRMPGVEEKSACLLLERSFFRVMQDSELMRAVEVTRFASMMNSSVLTGELLSQGQMVAYLTREQNELIQLPEQLQISFDAEDDLARYLAPLKDFAGTRQEMQVKDQCFVTVTLPINSDNNLLALVKMDLIISEEDEDKQMTSQDIKALVSALQLEASRVLSQNVFSQARQNHQFKECFDQLQTQINSLTIDLDFMQALQQSLVLPFTQAPSAKLLGRALTTLSNKVLPQMDVEAISLSINSQTIIQDIRLLDWRHLEYDQQQDFRSDSALPVSFNITKKTVCLHIPALSDPRGIIIRLRMHKDIETKEEQYDFLVQQCEVFQMIITPFVQAAMSSLSMTALLPAKQEQLPRVISKIVMQRKYGHIYNFFMRLKELQVNKVPIFTRLASYKNIVKRHYDKFGIEEQIGYDQDAKREYMTRERVLQIYAKAFQTLNGQALRTKKSYFGHYVHQVLTQMGHEQQQLEYEASYQPTKTQRKSLSIIYKYSRKLTLRAFFAKFAIMAKKFRLLNNPHNKEMAAAFCIFTNYNRMKERMAFQRMRANAADKYYRDFAGAEIRDRETMIHLSKILLATNLNSQDASLNLENAITTVLEQSLTYLQEQMCHETLDVIIVSIQQSSQRKARAYVFNNRFIGEQRTKDIQRVPSREVIDGVTSTNIGMLVENLEGLQDMTLSFKRDIILQMLRKSQTMFNFSNISQSLYDLYLNHLSRGAAAKAGAGSATAPQNVDNETASRMMLVKKSKSALIIPLLVPFQTSTGESMDMTNMGEIPEFKIAGSLELYKFHYQPFDEEMERRIGVFAKVLANDILPVYFSLRQTQIQIDSLRKQISRNSKPVTSLSGLLRQVYFMAPSQLNASQILPIIIEQKNKNAYFYQFKDNHIYNFAYSETFIGELVDYACILELAASDQTDQEANIIAETDREDTSVCSTDRRLSKQVFDFDQSIITERGLQQHKRRAVDSGMIRSVTNEKFLHILYYPVVSGPLGKTKAVVEVCFNSQEKIPRNVLTNQIQTFLENFGSQLNSLESRIRTFCKFTETAVAKRDGICKTRYFQRWKTGIILEDQKREFVHNQKVTINQTEQAFNEYIKSLECYDNELKKLVQQRENLTTELQNVNLDRSAKYKFLGASIILLQGMEKAQKHAAMKQMFNRWRYNQSIGKIAETAFNKILELNHRHSDQRFQSACFLLRKSIGKIMMKNALEKVSNYATMNQLRKARQKPYYVSSNISGFDVESRRSADKLSNVLGTGILKGMDSSHPSVSQPVNKGYSQGSFMTPNTATMRTYDSQITQYGVQMGFGAVPPRVQSKEMKNRRRSGSRQSRTSSSQRRLIK